MTKDNKKTSPLKITTVVIECILMAIVIAISVYTIVDMTNRKAELQPNFIGKKAMLNVLTNSMHGDKEDSFDEGDLVIVRKYELGEELEEGDIVTFIAVDNGRQFLNSHRIIGINRDSNGQVRSYVTKGDNNPVADDDLYTSQIKGVYVKHVKKLGKPITFLQNSKNFLLVIMVPVIVLVVVNVIELVRMIMKMKMAKLKEAYSAHAETEEEMRARIMAEIMAGKNAEAENIDDSTEE